MRGRGSGEGGRERRDINRLEAEKGNDGWRDRRHEVGEEVRKLKHLM